MGAASPLFALDFYPSSQFLGTNFLRQTNAANALAAIGGTSGGSGTATNLAGNALVQVTNIAASIAGSAMITNIYLTVQNLTGTTISNGSAVTIVAGNGTLPKIALAQATTNFTASGFDSIGIAAGDIAQGASGSVCILGTIGGVNTDSWITGSTLWLSTNAGALMTNPPSSDFCHVIIGAVARANSNNGVIFVQPQQAAHVGDISGFTNAVISIANAQGFLTTIPVSATNQFLTAIPVSATNQFLTSIPVGATNQFLTSIPVSATNQFLVTIPATATNSFALKTNAVFIGTATLNGTNFLTNGQSGPITFYGDNNRTNSWTFSSSGETRTNNGAGIGRTISLMTGTETWTGTNGSVNYVVYSNANNTVTFNGSHVGNGAGLTNAAGNFAGVGAYAGTNAPNLYNATNIGTLKVTGTSTMGAIDNSSSGISTRAGDFGYFTPTALNLLTGSSITWNSGDVSISRNSAGLIKISTNAVIIGTFSATNGVISYRTNAWTTSEISTNGFADWYSNSAAMYTSVNKNGVITNVFRFSTP